MFQILDSHGQNYIATVRVNAFLLAVGPSDCRVEIKRNNVCYGILLFKCSFHQMQRVSISLNEIKVSIDGLVPGQISTDFIVKMPAAFSSGAAESTTIKSGLSKPISGKFTRFKKAQTKFSYTANGYGSANVTFDTNIESLCQSTIKIRITHVEEEEVVETKPNPKKLKIDFPQRKLISDSPKRKSSIVRTFTVDED